MTEHDPAGYGRRIAAEYDELYERTLPTDDAVAALYDLAAGGPVLELGIGTGRLALPLVTRGLSVAGIEGSPEMVERLRAKPGGAAIEVVVGDFTEETVAGAFSLVVLSFNTIFALPSQDAQVRCFANAAAHLKSGGRFVLEAFVPDIARFRRGQAVRVLDVRESDVMIEVATIDEVRQTMHTTKVRLGERGVRLFPAIHRYAWPAELDLMAGLAGMQLEHRWSDWTRRSFTASSTEHVSVYVRS